MVLGRRKEKKMGRTLLPRDISEATSVVLLRCRASSVRGRILLLLAVLLTALALSYSRVSAVLFNSSKTWPRAREDSVGGCLIVMNDNHKLVEWLAYNYHVMPMRHLIIIEDPKSTQNIDRILKRWDGRIQITRWTDDNLYPSQNALNASQTGLAPRERYRTRHKVLFAQCLKEYKRRGMSWVMLTDDDEYVYINPRVNNYFSQLYRPHAPPLTQSGSVLSFLKKEQGNNQITSPCITMARYQFNARESTDEQVAKDLPQSATAWLDPKQLFSFRWRHTAKLCSYGKNLINVAALSLDDIPEETFWTHRNLPKICPRTSTFFTNDGNSVLLANHYLGTWEQYSRAGDAREEHSPRMRRTFERLQEQNRIGLGSPVQDNIRLWLPGFVDSVGQEDAKMLLEGAGVVGYE